MTPLTICLIICVLTMISYMWGKIPMGLTTLLSMAAFILTGCLDPKTALGYKIDAYGVVSPLTAYKGIQNVAEKGGSG